MGLDTTHDCWHGAYSAFHRWRCMIAKAAGVPLLLMDGFYSDRDRGMGLRTSLKYATAGADSIWTRSLQGDLFDWLPISWDALKPDPLHVLLSHSDCDGEIASKDCGPIADRLEALLPALEEAGDGGGHIGHYAEKTRTFIAGLREAAERGENVEFH